MVVVGVRPRHLRWARSPYAGRLNNKVAGSTRLNHKMAVGWEGRKPSVRHRLRRSRTTALVSDGYAKDVRLLLKGAYHFVEARTSVKTARPAPGRAVALSAVGRTPQEEEEECHFTHRFARLEA
jgi:hypothetical protein